MYQMLGLITSENNCKKQKNSVLFSIKGNSFLHN